MYCTVDGPWETEAEQTGTPSRMDWFVLDYTTSEQYDFETETKNFL